MFVNKISKRLQNVIRKEFENSILPVKSKEGILVGNVLIVSRGTIKDIVQHGETIYTEVHLNCAAIAIANLAARSQYRRATLIYRADQDYSRAFFESQLLRSQYEKAINTNDYFKADMLWARYLEVRDRTLIYKNKVEVIANLKINK